MPNIRERLQEVVQEFDEIEAALFTTFNFDPEFFEENVLPVLFGVEVGASRAVRRRAVHDGLARTPVGVCFDASVARAGVDDYRYTAYPVRLPGAFFHPKNIILVGWRDERLWLYISAASSNLSLSGWGLNVEGFADVWIHAKPQQPWQATDEFLRWVASQLKLGRNKGHPIAQIRELMGEMNERRTAALDPEGRDWRELEAHALYFSTEYAGLQEFIDTYYGGEQPRRICFASPYWSEVAANVERFGSLAWELIPALTTRRDRTGLAADEAATVGREGAVTISRWDDERDGRFRHAKMIRIEYPRRRVVTGIGSCNFTTSGLRGNRNVESMLFSTDRFLLPPRSALADEELATEAVPEEEAPRPPDWSMQVIYDWNSARCRWRVETGTPPPGARLKLEGLGSYSLDGVTSGEAEWPQGPRKGRGFRVVWEERGEKRSWSGWILELNLDQTTKVYGAPLAADEILDSWRNRTASGVPVVRGPRGEDEAEEPPETVQQPLLNLFELYRSVRELEEALEQGELPAHELLVTGANSVFALAHAIVHGNEPVPVRYLVLKEADRLLMRFRREDGGERRGAHRAQVEDWLNQAREEVCAMLSRERPDQSAEALLAWFEERLSVWEGS